MKDLKSLNRVLLKLSGEALAGEKKTSIIIYPFFLETFDNNTFILHTPDSLSFCKKAK